MKVIEIASQYFNSIKYLWQIPEKRNKCIVLSCFRGASKAAFQLQRNQQVKGLAIPTKRKDRCFLQQHLFKNYGEHAYLDNFSDGGDRQLNIPSRQELSWEQRGRSTPGQAQAHCPWDWMYARDFEPDDFTAKTGSTSQSSLFVWIQSVYKRLNTMKKLKTLE